MRFVVISLLALLASCGVDKSAVESAAATAAVGPSSPTSQPLADLYNRSCRSCHAQGAATAPKTGDFSAWQPRLAQGMPPMGMCFDCEEEDFLALIRFMSRGEG